MTAHRIGLSIRLGAMGGIIWGLFFTAYYSMLPNFKFAMYASTLCFIAIVVFLLSLPTLVKAFKEAAEEGRRNREMESEDEDEDEE